MISSLENQSPKIIFLTTNCKDIEYGQSPTVRMLFYTNEVVTLVPHEGSEDAKLRRKGDANFNCWHKLSYTLTKIADSKVVFLPHTANMLLCSEESAYVMIHFFFL